MDGEPNLSHVPKRSKATAPTHTQLTLGVGNSALGWLGVVVAPEGLAAVWLGASAQEVRAALGEVFARVRLCPAEGLEAAQVQQVVAYVAGEAVALPLPLHLAGTTFQRRVWHALGDIPRGATCSYRALAATLQVAGGSRAVAGACAANRHAVVVPCHRVVRHDGGLSGYRWGIARKRALLLREAHAEATGEGEGAGAPRRTR